MTTAETTLVPIASAEVAARPRLQPVGAQRAPARTLLLAPAFLLLAAVVLYPIAELIITSFRFYHLAQPWMGTPVRGLRELCRCAERRPLLGSDAHTR